MNWEDDEFARDLQRYSEIETIPQDEIEPSLPRTIQQYQQRIQSNNSTSIFDVDYTLEGAGNSSESAQEVNKNFDEDLGVFKDEKVTYIISGRGRGGRNILVTPGEPNRNKVFNGDDEVRQQIRKVAPIGYSNEITESAVRAYKMAQVLEKDPNANISPAISEPNSKPNSPIVSKASSKANSISPVPSSKTKSILNVESPALSGKSTPSTTASDVQSSDYYTSQDHNVSSSSSKSIQNTEHTEESQDECSEASTSSTSNIPQNFEVCTGEIEKKTVPLSVILKQSREAHKRKQLAREKSLDPVLSNGYSKDYENELASQQKIAEILRRDHLEQKLRKKKQISDKSSSSSFSSRDDSLSWRRRNNSPPRHPWGRDLGQGDWRKASQKLDINSIEDFPALK